MKILYSGTERPSSLAILKRSRITTIMFSYAQFAGNGQRGKNNSVLKWLARGKK